MRRPRTSSASKRGCRRSGSRSRSRLVSCAASTTTRALCSSSRAARSMPRRTRSAVVVATTAWRKRWAARPRRRSASVPASNACSSRATRKACCPCRRPRLDAFVVDLVGVADTARLLAELRESGLAADRAYGSRSPKKQFTAADRSGARWAVIVGADEAKRGMVAVKDLRSDKPQCEVRREEIAAWLLTRKDEARS